MSHLSISLFGGFQVRLDGQSLTDFGTEKNRALLAYLALESADPHRRETLATLLWPDRSEAQARNSLRQALYRLRQIIPTAQESKPHLLFTPEQLQFNPASDHWVDALDFKSRLSACQSHHPGGANLCPNCLDCLEQAVELYQGEMLEGFNLPGCTRFTDWQIITQEACHRQALAALSLLAATYESQCAYEQLIACSQKEIELEPWRESAYRRLMWALAMSGQRQRAQRLYATLREVLQQELGMPPMWETSQLYEQIRIKGLPLPQQLPGKHGWPFSLADHVPLKPATPFVERQTELSRLHREMSAALAGRARIAFIVGETGSGKTALLNEFAYQAIQTYGDLLVAGGTCSDLDGRGDHYQPFREIFTSLAGINGVTRHADAIPGEHTRRLSASLPVFLELLLETGAGLFGTLLPARELHKNANATGGLNADTTAGLSALKAHFDRERPTAKQSKAYQASQLNEAGHTKQMSLFDQVARLLSALSQRFPLLIMLDDLQWADPASAGLLFHLGSHLQRARILILGAYRPEDFSFMGHQNRHPLARVLNEFQRRFGDIEVNLSRANGEAFVQAYLDNLPNRFDRRFREMLFRHTQGNPLFTVELLQAMQARGELIKDETGYWATIPDQDWEHIPARLEAILAERVGRLDSESRSLLEAASVQGEIFSPAVLAWVMGSTEVQICACLSGTLGRQHHLVKALNPGSLDGSQEACYRFRHLLMQKYLYQHLDEVERALLQQATAIALQRSTFTRTHRTRG